MHLTNVTNLCLPKKNFDNQLRISFQRCQHLDMPEDGRDKQWLKPGSLVIFSKNLDTAYYADLDPSFMIKIC